MRRQGVTLVEVLVAFAVASGFLVVAWNALSSLRRQDEAGGRRAQVAMVNAQVLELALRDLRSAQGPAEDLEDGMGFRMWRAVRGPDGALLEGVEVTWRKVVDAEGRVVAVERHVADQPDRRFPYEGLLDDTEAVSFELRAKSYDTLRTDFLEDPDS